ncbi:unnamed protein product [Oncorhynchus mykiss]|uniref:Uncharacterized protein n=1 Tax=Oncorhynchus mykiss TaxID=8022 RepID=A0A060Z2J4_ONCMY|nr:unnamed protein product [Oncorhynchus mykiss]
MHKCKQWIYRLVHWYYPRVGLQSERSQLRRFLQSYIFFGARLLTQKGTMVMLKISAFLVAYALVICQMYSSQAAPTRTGIESMTDQVTLTDYEARRLLNAIVKEFVQMTTEELEQQMTEGNRYRQLFFLPAFLTA